LLRKEELAAAACRRLLRFYRAYQEKNLTYFLALRRAWQRANGGRSFPGLCANINPITGEFRAATRQRLWGWGDARALSTWSAFMNRGRVAEKKVVLRWREGLKETVDMRSSLEDYIDEIYRCLLIRIELNGGTLPFAAFVDTQLADGSRRLGGESPMELSDVFAAGGFLQYGLLRVSGEAIRRGLDLMDRGVQSFRQAISRADSELTPPAIPMIILGFAAEVLKSLRDAGIPDLPELASGVLMEKILPLVDHLLDFHYSGDPPAYRERVDIQRRPIPDASGHLVVDPGHATELAGFLAELAPFLPETWGSSRWNRERVLEAAVKLHLFADALGFTPAGVMCKYVDFNTGQPLPDTQAPEAEGRLTAPWWNVREHAAGALRLFVLTGRRELLGSYKRAQNASYLHYPNRNIGGQMIQTVDPITLEPLDIAPATENLDPMHDPLARLREIESLEELLKR
jgi:hypothetical protein